MNCKTCKYFKNIDKDNQFCHRYPPIPHTSGSIDDISSYNNFVQVSENEWCGEYKEDVKKKTDQFIQGMADLIKEENK